MKHDSPRSLGRALPVEGEVTFEQDIGRDAALVRMCMVGAQVQAGMRFGMKPDDLIRHGEWLREQPEDYIERVVARVEADMDRTPHP